MRRKSIFWGSLLILLGLALLADQFVDIGKYILPAVLIYFGLWFLLRSLFYKPRISNDQINYPLEGVREAELRLVHGAGCMQIKALESPDTLMQGHFTGGVESDIERHGEWARIRLKASHEFFMPFPGLPVDIPHGFEWHLELNRQVVYYLRIKGGANECNLDLTDLLVKEIKIDTGASATTVSLPAKAGYTRLEVNSGAASVSIHVPQGVAARIVTRDSGMAAIQVDTMRFPATLSGFEATNYETAANRVEILVKAGVGSVEIR